MTTRGVPLRRTWVLGLGQSGQRILGHLAARLKPKLGGIPLVGLVAVAPDMGRPTPEGVHRVTLGCSATAPQSRVFSERRNKRSKPRPRGAPDGAVLPNSRPETGL